MSIRRSFFLPLIITYTFIFTTTQSWPAIDNYHLANLYHELDQTVIPSQLTRSIHKEEKITHFTNAIQNIIANTDQTIYKNLFENIATTIHSNHQDVPMILDDLLNYYDIKNTPINKNTFLLDTIATINDYCAQDFDPNNIKKLTHYVLDELTFTAESLHNPTKIKVKKKRKKSRFLKKRYLYYLLSFLGISLSITIVITLYNKIQSNIKQAEQLALQQREALAETKKELEQTKQKLQKQIETNKLASKELATRNKKRLQETIQIQERLNHVEKYHTQINQLEEENKKLENLLENNKQNLQQIKQKNITQEKQIKQIEHYQIQIKKLELENKNASSQIQANDKKIKIFNKTNTKEISEIKKQITTLERLEIKINNNTQGVKRVDNLLQRIEVDQARLKEVEKENKLLKEDILKKLEQEIKLQYAQNETLKAYFDDQKNNPGAIKAFFGWLKAITSYATSNDQSSSSQSSTTTQNQTTSGFNTNGFITNQEDLALLERYNLLRNTQPRH